MTLDVAGCARINVAPPGPSDAVVTLDDHQVVDTGAAQRGRRAKAAESRTDDRHLWRETPPGRRPQPAEDVSH